VCVTVAALLLVSGIVTAVVGLARSPRGFMHMKIVSCDDAGSCGGGHYILGQFSQPFDSIPQMIHHYTINKLPIKGAEHMSLLHPVNNELL